MSDSKYWQLTIRAREKDSDAVSELYYLTVKKLYIFVKTILGDEKRAKSTVRKVYLDTFAQIEKSYEGEDFETLLIENAVKLILQRVTNNREADPVINDVDKVSNIKIKRDDIGLYKLPSELDASDFIHDITDAMDELTARMRLVFMLFFCYGFSLGQIAVFCNTGKKSVAGILYSALQKLDSELEYIKNNIPKLSNIPCEAIVTLTFDTCADILCEDLDIQSLSNELINSLKENGFLEPMAASDFSLDGSGSFSDYGKSINNEESEAENLSDMGMVKVSVPFSQKPLAYKLFIYFLIALPILFALFYILLVVHSYIQIKNNAPVDTNVYVFSTKSNDVSDNTIIAKPKTTKSKTTTTTKAEARLTGIIIGSPTTKTYSLGQPLSFTLVGQYSDGSVKKITGGYSVIGNTNTPGTQTIVVTYNKMTTQFNIEVKRSMKSISVFSHPSKQTYYVGETLDTSGLRIKVTFDDGTSETVASGFSCSPSALESSGTKKITVSYGSLTTSFSVTVKAKPTTTAPTTARTTRRPTTEPTTTTAPTTTEPSTTRPESTTHANAER